MTFWWKSVTRFRVSVLLSNGEFVFCGRFPIRMIRNG